MLSIGSLLQHDILWDELTALEHMELFAGMKDIPKDRVNVEIYSLLDQVQLSHVSLYAIHVHCIHIHVIICILYVHT